jgi:hypothetical protein
MGLSREEEVRVLEVEDIIIDEHNAMIARVRKRCERQNDSKRMEGIMVKTTGVTILTLSVGGLLEALGPLRANSAVLDLLARATKMIHPDFNPADLLLDMLKDLKAEHGTPKDSQVH